MKEEKIEIFVDIVENFFAQFNDEDVVVDTPFLHDNDEPRILEYTGLIGISGSYKGVVYMTASKQLLIKSLEAMGEMNSSQEIIIDLVGEIANTISGNARQVFGSEFHISVPFVFQGAPKKVILPKNERSVVIPIKWKSETGEIVIYLQS